MGDHVARLAVVLALASAQSVGSTAVLSFTAPVRGELAPQRGSASLFAHGTDRGVISSGWLRAAGRSGAEFLYD